MMGVLTISGINLKTQDYFLEGKLTTAESWRRCTQLTKSDFRKIREKYSANT